MGESVVLKRVDELPSPGGDQGPQLDLLGGFICHPGDDVESVLPVLQVMHC